MAIGSLATGGAVLGFYQGPDGLVPFAWILLVFCMMGMGVLFKALGTELFPTSHRSTASGVRGIVGTLGGVAGLAIEGWHYDQLGSHAAAITATLPALLIPPLVITLFVPETASRELEDIAPEKATTRGSRGSA
jgi:MFS family permease